jgi:hypothetical protein
MKLVALGLVLVAACQSGGGDDYPLGPPGGGVVIGGAGGGGDAGIGDGGDAGDAGDDAGVAITGRVCILKDLRFLTDCDTSAKASALTVSIGATRSVHPADTGEFTITAPLGAFTWHVTGLNFITSVMSLESVVSIPVIGDDLYSQILGANSVVIAPLLQGSIVVRVVSGVTAVLAVNATSNPAANNLAFYDGDSDRIWRNDTNGTGAKGVVWLPGVQLTANPTNVSVTLIPQGAPSVTTQVSVEDQAITFVTKDLP